MSEAAEARFSDWGDCSAEQIRLLRRVLLDVVRDLSRSVPPPRGMPFFGLDHPAGELTPFERLAARGIFRKYESVLLIGSGLGGAARWCHTHFGCDVTGVDSVAAVTAAAAELSARSRLSARTHFVAAASRALPLRERRFTHAWHIEGLLDAADHDPCLKEIFRVVRLGALVAVQQSEAPSGWAQRVCLAMASAGFTETTAEIVQRPPLREGARRARERLLQALRAVGEPLGAETAAVLEGVYGAWPLGGGTVTQVFARRPS